MFLAGESIVARPAIQHGIAKIAAGKNVVARSTVEYILNDLGGSSECGIEVRTDHVLNAHEGVDPAWEIKGPRFDVIGPTNDLRQSRKIRFRRQRFDLAL